MQRNSLIKAAERTREIIGECAGINTDDIKIENSMTMRFNADDDEFCMANIMLDDIDVADLIIDLTEEFDGRIMVDESDLASHITTVGEFVQTIENKLIAAGWA